MTGALPQTTYEVENNAIPLIMSCGEPSGVGPELALASRLALKNNVPFAWLGDPRHLPLGVAIKEIEMPSEVWSVPDHMLPVIPHAFDAPAVPGKPSLLNAAGVVDTIARAVSMVQKGSAGGIVTAPIHKKILKEGAGFAFPGHTEYLAHLAGNVPVAMMLTSERLRVVPATIHIPLADVPKTLTSTLLEQAIRLSYRGLMDFWGIAFPRLVVAGLNPHAGEGGVMGDEEELLFRPVIKRLNQEGLNVKGPLPADSLFHAQARKGYDVVICAYHDQALIPIKTLDFDAGVNVTLGLPFVRVSPDHGTALDIAGTGKARPNSMIEACRLAWRMAKRQSILPRSI